MKIALVTQLFPPETAAGARRTGALAAALHPVSALHVFTVCPSYPHPSLYDWNGDDYPLNVTRIGTFLPHRANLIARALGEMRLAVRLACRVAYARPDVVVASSPSMFLGPVCWIVARLLRVPFVWDIRDLTWEYSREQAEGPLSRPLAGLAASAMWAVCRRADLVVAATDGIKRALLGQFVSADRVISAPNRPSRATVSSPSCSLAPPPGWVPGACVLYAGVVGRNQGLEVLLDVAARRPNIEFAIAGDGPERGPLEVQASAMALRNVRFAGFLDPDQLAAAYGAADVLFAQIRDTPALARDSIPSKLFEYMAAGRPIVYAGRGAAAEMLLHSGTAAVVPPSDVEAIAAAVDRLLADGGEAGRLVERARAYVEEGPFCEEVMAGVADATAALGANSR